MKARFAVTALATILTALVASPGQASPPARPRCLGHVATIVGTPGVDTIRGTSGSDVIVGGGGGADGRRGDTIYGLGGDDLICDNATQPVLSDLRGGSGNDTVRASGIMRGGPGRDTLLIRDGSISMSTSSVGQATTCCGHKPKTSVPSSRGQVTTAWWEPPGPPTTCFSP
jgi:hypothetical protein